MQETSKKKLITVDRILCMIASLVVPNMFLFDSYNRNRIRNELPFDALIIIAISLAVASLIIFILLSLLAKGSGSALIVTILWWVGFWFFEAIYGSMSGLISERGVWLGVIAAVIIVISILLRRFAEKLKKASMVFRVISVVFCVLFATNAIPAILHQIEFQRGINERYEAFLRGEEVFYIKRDFNIDDTLPSPDVYWIHMDSMMNLEDIERFFGQSQDSLREGLSNRGFVLSRDTLVNAGWTDVAMPVLLSPAFYDSYFGVQLAEIEHLSGLEREEAVGGFLARDGINFRQDVLQYPELLRAFSMKEYSIVGVAWLLDKPFDIYYGNVRVTDNPLLIVNEDYTKNATQRFIHSLGHFPELLIMTTPFSMMPAVFDLQQYDMENAEKWLPIPNHEVVDTLMRVDGLTAYNPEHPRIRQYYNTFIDSLETPSPKFTFVANYFSHLIDWWLHDPDLLWENAASDAYRADLYIYGFNYAVESMLQKIDIILAQNPDAIIVIQGDHGMHHQASHQTLREMGWSDEDVRRQQLSAFSAVRIPQIYGGLDAPLDPRNISRELVNRFVGENYELLP